MASDQQQIGLSADTRPVAPWVVDVIGAGEAARLARVGVLHRRVKRFQNALARQHPRLATTTDWSLGRYYIRPSTARAALDWAFAVGMAPAHGYSRRPSDSELVRAILDPERAAALVAIILAYLRASHPRLHAMTWDEIEASDRAIAKLFSGWLGAGGYWVAWRSDATPGPRARRYLDCTTDGIHCALVRAHRIDTQRESC